MLIRNATLPDGRTGIDLLVRDGRIQALGEQLFAGQPAPAGAQTLDAQGWLLSPPFVDAHFHLDATLSYGLPRTVDGAERPSMQAPACRRSRPVPLRSGTALEWPNGLRVTAFASCLAWSPSQRTWPAFT